METVATLPYFDVRPTDAAEDRDLARLEKVLGVMVADRFTDLVDLLLRLKRLTDGEDPLMSAFCCLTMAETMLFKVDLARSDAMAACLRRYAVVIAKVIAARAAPT